MKINIFLTILTAVILGALIAYGGWFEPTANPPEGNVAAPINVGNVGQAKEGGLQLNALGTAPAGLIVSGDATHGLVGIGTANPKNKLDVEGGAVIGSSYSGSVNAPADGLLIQGRTGIGIQTPGAKLHVSESTSLYPLRVDDTNDDDTPFVINSIGNVGIGVLEPSVKLEIQKTLRLNPFIQLGSDGLVLGAFDFFGPDTTGADWPWIVISGIVREANPITDPAGLLRFAVKRQTTIKPVIEIHPEGLRLVPTRDRTDGSCSIEGVVAYAESSSFLCFCREVPPGSGTLLWKRIDSPHTDC